MWNQFDTCPDHETIKAEFIRRVHRKNPPFRFKLKPKPRHCAEIPPMVEFHYKHPPALLPSLRDVLRCERVYHKHGLPNIVNPPDEYYDLDNDLKQIHEAHKKVRQFEDEVFQIDANEVNDKIAIDESDTMNGQTKILTEAEIIENIVESIPLENDEKTIEKIENKSTFCETPEPVAENGASNEHFAPEIENSNSNSVSDSLSVDAIKLKSNRKRKRYTSSKSFGAECDDLLALSEEVFKSKLMNGTNGEKLSSAAIDDQLDGLDVDVIKRLALAQLQQILKESPELVTKYQNESANKAIKDALKVKPVKITLPSQLLSKDDIAKIAEQFANSSASDDSDVNDPAYAGIPRPISPKPQFNSDAYCYANGFEHIKDDNERALAIAQRLERPLRESKVRARAVLTPVGDILAGKQWYTNSHLEDSIFMRYRNLVIGSGPGCDFQMKDIHKCARLSSHHATIFYDEVRQTNTADSPSEYNLF